MSPTDAPQPMTAAEALEAMVRDMEVTYDACKRPKSSIEITIGQFRRLNAARAALAAKDNA